MWQSKKLGVVIIVLLITTIIGYGSYLYINTDDNEVFISTTTSVQNTGLLDYLIQEYEKQSKYNVKYTAVGSGAAIQLARDGEVDAVLVHAPDLEKSLVSDGYADMRHTLWYNYFIIAGPQDDPAGINQTASVISAFERIYTAGEEGNTTFYSRGDQSGTHLKEQKIWNKTSYEVNATLNWYIETGTGMSATLTAADNDVKGYALTDIGTYATLRGAQTPIQLQNLYNKDPDLYNPYSYLIIDADRINSELNTVGARHFLEFLDDPSTDNLVKNYTKNGIVLFNPVDDGN